jgi:hypothetical protein
VTHDGAIVHEPTREAVEGPPGEAPADPAVRRDDQLDLPYDQEADQ